jgi:hypothetical protein
LAKKQKTLEQVETTQTKAAQFTRDVLRDDDLADSLEDEDPESYAERKHISIINSPVRRGIEMANGNGSMTTADLADVCDQVQDILEDAYTPEASREDLAAAIGDALDLLENGPEDDTGADDSDDLDDGDLG